MLLMRCLSTVSDSREASCHCDRVHRGPLLQFGEREREQRVDTFKIDDLISIVDDIKTTRTRYQKSNASRALIQSCVYDFLIDRRETHLTSVATVIFCHMVEKLQKE